MPTRIELYKKERRRFAIYVYVLTILFFIIALVQWYLVWYFTEAHDFFREKFMWSASFFIIALIGTTVFIFYEDLRFMVPINWLIGFLIVEFMILSLPVLIVRQTENEILFQFLIWAVIVIIFLFIGIFMPHDLTLDVVVLFVLAVVALIGAIYFLMLYVVINIPYAFIIHRVFIVGIVLMFVMYHAQIISGGRFAEMRVQDIILGALILFLDFILVYLFTFISTPKWSDRCNKHLNKTRLIVFEDSPKSKYYNAESAKYH